METRVNASTLQANRAQYEERCVVACVERLNRCLAEIERIAETFPAQDYTVFTIPYVLDNDPPQLSRERCIIYLIEELRKLRFFVKRCKNEDIFISWDPKHTPSEPNKPQTMDRKRTRPRRKLGVSGVSDYDSADDEGDIITYRPNSEFGDLHLRTQLMAKNPKYSRHAHR